MIQAKDFQSIQLETASAWLILTLRLGVDEVGVDVLVAAVAGFAPGAGRTGRPRYGHYSRVGHGPAAVTDGRLCIVLSGLENIMTR